MMAKPMKTLELHYPMNHFLIIMVIYLVLQSIPTHVNKVVKEWQGILHLVVTCKL